MDDATTLIIHEANLYEAKQASPVSAILYPLFWSVTAGTQKSLKLGKSILIGKKCTLLRDTIAEQQISVIIQVVEIKGKKSTVQIL